MKTLSYPFSSLSEEAIKKRYSNFTATFGEAINKPFRDAIISTPNKALIKSIEQTHKAEKIKVQPLSQETEKGTPPEQTLEIDLPNQIVNTLPYEQQNKQNNSSNADSTVREHESEIEAQSIDPISKKRSSSKKVKNANLEK